MLIPEYVIAEIALFLYGIGKSDYTPGTTITGLLQTAFLREFAWHTTEVLDFYGQEIDEKNDERVATTFERAARRAELYGLISHDEYEYRCPSRSPFEPRDLLSGCKLKKNCLNCRHGYWDGDTMESTGEESRYFVCEKFDGDDCKRDKQLSDMNYLKLGKKCCDLPDAKE